MQYLYVSKTNIQKEKECYLQSMRKYLHGSNKILCRCYLEKLVRQM